MVRNIVTVKECVEICGSIPEEVTEERYVVKSEVEDTEILVYLWDKTRKVCAIPRVYVSQPNWFERVIGVTFEQKIQKAVRKMQRIAEMYNAEEAVRIIKSKEASEAYLKAFVGERDV